MKTEFEVCNKEGISSNSIKRYDVLTGALEGESEVYEQVGRLEGNEGNIRVYRDSRTAAAISVETDFSPGRDDIYLTLVGDDSEQLNKTFKRIKSKVPNILEYKLCDDEK